MKKVVVMLAMVSLVLFTNAQQQDSLVTADDTNNQLRKFSGKRENYFSAKSVSVPGVFILYGFASLQIEGVKEINIEVKEEILENNPGFRTRVDDYLQFAPAAGIFLLDAGGIKGKHNLKDKATIYGMGMVIMITVVYSLKKITHQLRPDGSKYNSFPSGHTTNAFMGAEFLNQEYGFRSPLYGYTGYATAAGTRILRMYNNKHWFGDVLTGAGIGILSAKISYWIFSKIEKKRNQKSVGIIY